MAKNEQQLEGGDESTNVMAGRDIVTVGISATEARDIALGVYNENVLELRGVAEDIAFARAERLTTEFLTQLQDGDPKRMKVLGDPDFQHSLFNAQRSFACSGEEDLQDLLVDLLVARTDGSERNLRLIALNEAIDVVSKLTEEQRRAVAAIFLLRYTRHTYVANIQSFVALLQANLVPLVNGIPNKNVEYQHIEYVGAGSIGLGQIDFGKVVRHGNDGLFTVGFTTHDIPSALDGTRLFHTYFKPNERIADNYSIRADSEQDVATAVTSIADEALRAQIIALSKMGHMSNRDVENEIVGKVPELKDFVALWNTTLLRNMTLTSVGMVIGHSYWQRTTGQKADLSTWL